jgi:hypothetical protein
VVAPVSDSADTEFVALLRSILNWLRAGYPDRAPGPERVPLLALLRPSPLTEDQVEEVFRNITAEQSSADAKRPIHADDIAAAISDVTGHDAGPENTRLVAAKLAAAGWSLEGIEEVGT